MNIFGLNGLYCKYTTGQTTITANGSITSINLDAVDPVFASTYTYPSHFSIPLESGALTAAQVATGVVLLERFSGAATPTPKLAQFEAAAYWPDNSVKWLHAFTDLKWQAGVKPTYTLAYGPGITRYSVPSSPMTAVTSASGLDISTGAATFTIRNSAPLIGNGAYVLLDGAGNSYSPTGVSFSVVQSGGQQITVQVTGRMMTTGGGEFMSFVSYISASANSAIVKYQHSAIFTADMRSNFVRGLAFRFDNNTSQILTRRFDKKLPYEVTAAGGSTFVTLWPSGRSDTQVSSDWSVENGFKLAYLHKGSGANAVLNVNLPTGYNDLFRNITTYNSAESALSDGIVNYTDSTQATDLIGFSMDAEFAINLGSSGTEAQQMFEHNPIGYREVVTAVESNAYGLQAGKQSATYANFDQSLNRGIYGYWYANERHQDYGWHRYGQTHDGSWGLETTPGVSGQRPKYYRASSNDHYNTCELAWRQFFSTADTGCLHVARVLTDHQRALSNIKHPVPSGRESGRFVGVDSHAYSLNGMGPNHGLAGYNDQFQALGGHFTLKSRLLLSWLIDGNRWAKSGYHQYIDTCVTRNHWTTFYNSYSLSRDFTVAFEEAMILYEYAPNTPNLLVNIHKFASGIIAGLPNGITTGTVNTAPSNTILVYPDFMTKYADLFPNYVHGSLPRTMEDTIIATANNFSGQTPIYYFAEYLKSIDAKAYELTGETRYMTKHGGWLAVEDYKTYDGSLPQYKWFHPNLNTETVYHYRGWGRFKRTALAMATPPALVYENGGKYINAATATSLNLTGETKAYATRIFIYNDTGAPTTYPDQYISALETWDDSYSLITTSGGLSSGNIIDHFQQPSSPGLLGYSYREYRASTFQQYKRLTEASGKNVPTGLSVVYIHGTNSIYGPQTEHPEAQVIFNGNYVAGRWDHYSNNSSGTLYPLVTPLTGVFRCTAIQPSYRYGMGWVSIGGSGKYLVAGETFQYVFTGPTTLAMRSTTNSIQCRFSGVTAIQHYRTGCALFGDAANINYLLPYVTGTNIA